MVTDDDERLAMTDEEHERPTSRRVSRYSDENLTLDAHEDDWAWRRKIRSNAHTQRIYRVTVALVGAVVVIAGLIMVPFPGPGWLVVFLGVAIWASEFEFAQRLLQFGKRTLASWNAWMKVQHWYVQALAAALTLAAVLAIFYALLLVGGVPGIFPDTVRGWLGRVPGLG